MARAALRAYRAAIGAFLVATLSAVVAWSGWHFLQHSGPAEAAEKVVAGEAAARPVGPPASVNGIRNVVLISIDTCRADHLSCYGYKLPTTPTIDGVARDGTMFKMALTPVPLTTPAHSSMFTGTYPPTHGVRVNTFDHLADSNVTLAKTLHDAGYQTAAFVGAFPLDARFGLNQGFDTYDGSFSDEMKGGVWSRRIGAEVNRPAISWLKEHAARPFFLFLHYYDAHRPYVPHPPATSPYNDDHYAGELTYIDNCIGRVLDQIRESGVYDETLVIITGDHGEGLGEHGEESHSFFIYQSTLHVPLVIRAPRGHKGIEVEANVSLVDIVPTVLDLVGLKAPARVEGVDLRPLLDGEPGPKTRRAIYAESLESANYRCSELHGVVENSWKYILAPRPELYDLSNDPSELINVAEKEPQVARRLRGRLEAMFTQLEEAATKRGPSVVDPEAVKRLQSLGYASGGAAMPASSLNTEGEDPKDFFPTYDRLVNAWSAAYGTGDKSQLKREMLEIAARRPRLIDPQKILAEIALKEHRPDEAARRFAIVVDKLTELSGRSPQSPGVAGQLADAQGKLALALNLDGDSAQAAVHYGEAIRLKGDFPETLNNLAWIRATNNDSRLRNGPEAVSLAQRACQLSDQREIACVDTLAAAYAESGRFVEAVATARRALDLAKQQDNSPLIESIQGEIRLYEAGKPLRDTASPVVKTPVRP